MTGSAARLAEAFWPGPLTIVLPRKPIVPDAATGGLDTVALRCPDHDIPLEAQTVSQMVDQVLALPEGRKLMLLAPVIRERKGEHLAVFEELRAQGFVRARVNGKLYELDELPKLDKQKKHSIDVVVDRLRRKEDMGKRLTDSVEMALKLARNPALCEVTTPRCRAPQ